MAFLYSKSLPDSSGVSYKTPILCMGLAGISCLNLASAGQAQGSSGTSDFNLGACETNTDLDQGAVTTALFHSALETSRSGQKLGGKSWQV